MIDVSSAPCMGCSRNMRVTSARVPKPENAFSEIRVSLSMPELGDFLPVVVWFSLFWCRDCTMQRYADGAEKMPDHGELFAILTM